MNNSKNIIRRKPRCEICGGITIYKGKSIGWKCVNNKCRSIEINRVK